ncbi:MAG: hypothetical protein IJK52_02835 [Oscillospiraceae bacterium]|nr:hypothetical protein [Oscillospiraceae bacterium]
MEANYTRLLGLALRGGNLVTGSDAVASAVSTGTARLLLLSADASVRTCKDAEAWAERGNCLLVALPCDKAELGGALGRGSVAVAALTDTGLAAAVGERLALYDSDRYGAVAERLRLKSKRAAERRTAHARARPDSAARKRKGAVPRKRDETPSRKRETLSDDTAPRKRETRPDEKPPRKRETHWNGTASRERKSRPDEKRTPRPNGAAARKPGAARPQRASRPDGTPPRKRESRPDGAASRKNPNAKK